MSTYRMTADAGYVIGPPGLGLLADVTSPAIAILAGLCRAHSAWRRVRRRHAGKAGAFGRVQILNPRELTSQLLQRNFRASSGKRNRGQ
jgi:hypothetical protein